MLFTTPLSLTTSLEDTSFHISLNSLGSYLSRMLVEFSLTCIFHIVWEKIFNLCSHSPKMHWMYHFYSCPSPPLKTPGRIFWESPPNGRGGRKLPMICSIKIQSENMKMTWNISLFPFGMIAIFLNVMTLQFCKQYQIVWY